MISSYWDIFQDVESKYKEIQLMVNTPIIEIEIDGIKLTIKDENKNINGSFKDRGLTYQIVKNIQNGNDKFALSSSGNSAISACYISRNYNVTLELFLSKNINKNKSEKINQYASELIKINYEEKPRSDLIKFLATNTDFINLRGSTDEIAPLGFKSIAYEITKQVEKYDAIFIPCSSGTSSLGIHMGFRELGIQLPIHVCQTEKVNAIAKNFDNDFNKSESSLADAITDKVAHRKLELIEIIKNTGGYGWVISNERLEEDIIFINNLLKTNYSYNSMLAFSGWKKSVEKGFNYKNPILLFSGL